MNFYQIFLPISSLLYFLLVFVLRSYLHWRQTGVNPFVFGNTQKPHDFIGSVYKIMVIFTWLSICIYSFFPELYHYLSPIKYLEFSNIKLAGLSLLLGSFLWTSIAQYQMSRSWRIGINYEEKTDLVSTGLFRYSRNPVFLGVLVSYAGTFLIIPNALSFGILMVTYVSLQTQVRMEEEYLQSVQGEVYLDYQAKVSRWLGRANVR